MDRKQLIDTFHIEYEEQRLFEKITWLGTPMYKLPFDAIVMQELILKIRPDLIIETGTAQGGSSLFFATIMELVGHGEVVTVDIEDKVQIQKAIAKEISDRRVYRVIGSSISTKVFDYISYIANGHEKILVTLDSWHTKEHVLKELQLYSPCVSQGSYLSVEDTHVNGNPVPWKWGEGPMEAVEEFLQSNSDFEIDKGCEKFYLTFSPNGYLRRK